MSTAPKNPNIPDNANWPALGEYIATKRKALKMSQGDLATKMHVHQPDVSMLESGTRASSVSTVWKAALALNVTPKTLFLKLEQNSTLEQ